MHLHQAIEEILPLVTKPSRYLGNEFHVVRKDPSSVDLQWLLILPEVYEIGMSHWGLKILYDILNRRPDTLAERAYCPWIDMEERMRRGGIPLFSLETRRPAREFDLVGFSLQYEMTATNILTCLDLAGIPIWAQDRTDSDPLVIGGGPCVSNPEPLAEFFDLFLIGDGEEAVHAISDRVRDTRGMPRLERLKALAGVPGLYVPGLYESRYDDAGRLIGTFPTCPEAPKRVVRTFLTDLEDAPYPAKPLVPLQEVVQDRLSIEVLRGCTQGCRFCQAGYPLPSAARAQSAEGDGPRGAGPQVHGLGRDLARLALDGRLHAARAAGRGAEQALRGRQDLDRPALAARRQLRGRDRRQGARGQEDGLHLRARGGERAAAPRGQQADHRRGVLHRGPRRLRARVAADQDLHDDRHADRDDGRRRGDRGLHREDPLDRPAVRSLLQGQRERGGLRARRATRRFSGTSSRASESLREKIGFLRSRIPNRWSRLKWHEVETSHIEAVLSRGDRRLARTIHRAWELGGRYDGWTEHFSHERWLRALEETGLSAEMFTRRYEIRGAAAVGPHRHRCPEEVPRARAPEDGRAGRDARLPSRRLRRLRDPGYARPTRG